MTSGSSSSSGTMLSSGLMSSGGSLLGSGLLQQLQQLLSSGGSNGGSSGGSGATAGDTPVPEVASESVSHEGASSSHSTPQHTAPAAAVVSGGSIPSKAAQLLPMAVLTGRCYQQYGSRLQQLLLGKGFQLSPTATPMGSVVNPDRPARDVFSAQEWAQVAEFGLAGRAQALLHTSSDTIRRWLHLPGVRSELCSAGYDVQLLDQLSHQLDGVFVPVSKLDRPMVVQIASSSMSGADVIALSRKLQAAGGALSSLAVKTICNNPGCTYASMQHEWQLVLEGRCSKCKAAAYCSRDCQAAHWKRHKPVCKAIAAANDAAVAAAAAKVATTSS
jgi:hypothetical protein